MKRKEAGSKPSTVGTPTGSEAEVRAASWWEQQSPIVIQTHQVEPDGAREQILSLPGEISSMRVEEKSAEAVVAWMPCNDGGAKGRRTKERS